jgi:tricorn protease
MHVQDRLLLAAALLFGTTSLAPVLAQTRLLRHPDLHGDRVVFTYAGDLWQASIQGGTATRLTSAPGLELFAKYSPDGRWVAFTGQIDGDEQVCVVPSDGGEIRQLTHYPARGPLPDRWGSDHQVHGWTPDGTAVLFRSLRETWSPASGRLFTVAMPAAARRQGALPQPLPMPTAGAGDFSPDGERIVFSPLFRDFRTWKRYEGGWAQDLYVFDPATGSASNITNHPRTDRDPMWIGDEIWFSSDRTGTLNLWSYDLRTRTVSQATTSTTWDVRWPSKGGPDDHRIVYELGGVLHWFDCRARRSHPITIRVPDEGLTMRPTTVDATGLVEHMALAPGGRRAAFAARGEILTVPQQHGDVRNLTRSTTAHDKHPAFSPDGARVAFVGDQTGEEQVFVVDHLGERPPVQLTRGLAAMLHAPKWSPDGRWLAFGDKDGVLRVVPADGGDARVVADEERGQIQDHVWSPCSGHLAFSLTTASDTRQICIWTLADGSLRRISRPLSHDHSPAFDARGERLFFLGLRGFQPRLSPEFEWDFQVDRAYGVFALALRNDLGPLLPRRSDEATAPPAADAKAPTFDAPITIDVDGLADRVETLPVPLDNLANLAAVPSGVVYTTHGGSYYGRDTDRPSKLWFFDTAAQKAHELRDDVRSFVLSPDGTHALVRQRSGHSIVKVAAGAEATSIDLRGLPVTKVAGDEHWQIFHETWRRFRDFFYVANMHGYDWVALREQYAPLLAHVRHRSDLNYVLGEMIAELNVGHAYIAGGDVGAPPRPAAALPGLVLTFDRDQLRYRIERVLRGQNDDQKLRSPATAVGVRLAAGDWLLAIDGVELTPETNPYALFRGKAGRAVSLTVNRRPTFEDSRVVTIEPIATEQDLRYHEWVEDNRRRTTERSGGRLGYVHLPDMGENGIREFVRQYYAQRDKEGLVIDDRGNGGGNVSQMVLNRLSRELLMCTFGRTTGYRPYPQALFHGHLICLLDENSASDGDIFPAMFKKSGLGKLVGKRSWGGIIGITNRGMLIDGGTVNVPEFGNTEPGGEWTIEGRGVEPDVVVENDLPALLQGKDPQLETAIDLLLQQIDASPKPRPTPPPAPIRTGR